MEPLPPQDGPFQYGSIVVQQYLLFDGGYQAREEIVLTEQPTACSSLGPLQAGLNLNIVPPASWDGGSTSLLCLGPSLEFSPRDGAAEYRESGQSFPRSVVVTLTTTDAGSSVRYVLASRSTTEVGVVTVGRCP